MSQQKVATFHDAAFAPAEGLTLLATGAVPQASTWVPCLVASASSLSFPICQRKVPWASGAVRTEEDGVGSS